MKEKIITFEKSALKEICKALGVPYDENIIGFTKNGAVKNILDLVLSAPDEIAMEKISLWLYDWKKGYRLHNTLEEHIYSHIQPILEKKDEKIKKLMACDNLAINGLQNEIEQLKKKIPSQDVMDDCNQARADMAEVTQDEEYMEQIYSRDGRILNLVSDVDKLTAENKSLREQVESIKKCNKGLDKDIEYLSNQLNQMREKKT